MFSLKEKQVNAQSVKLKIESQAIIIFPVLSLLLLGLGLGFRISFKSDTP